MDELRIERKVCVCDWQGRAFVSRLSPLLILILLARRALSSFKQPDASFRSGVALGLSVRHEGERLTMNGHGISRLQLSPSSGFSRSQEMGLTGLLDSK